MSPNQILQPELPGRQCLWQLTLRYIQHLGNYWARHLTSTITESFCRDVDLAITDNIMLATEIDISSLSDTAKERI